MSGEKNVVFAVDEDDLRYVLYTMDELEASRENHQAFPVDMIPFLGQNWIIARDSVGTFVLLNPNRLKRLELKEVKISKF